jgi:hypothetical protein
MGPQTNKEISMLRKLILAVAVGAGTLGVAGMTTNRADAADPPSSRYGYHRDHRVRYEVLYRHRDHWDVYACYQDRDDAQRAAWRLRRQGYLVRIEAERGGHERRW